MLSPQTPVSRLPAQAKYLTAARNSASKGKTPGTQHPLVQ
jgi:hypothetical protein